MRGGRRRRRCVRPDVFELEAADAAQDREDVEGMFDGLTPSVAKLMREQPAGECTCDPGWPGEGWDEASFGECDGGVLMPSERFYARR